MQQLLNILETQSCKNTRPNAFFDLT